MKIYSAFEVRCDRCGAMLIDPSSDCECYYTSNREAAESCVRQGWKTNGTRFHTCPECQRKFKEES